MLQRILDSTQVGQVADRLRPGGRVTLSGVWGSSAPALAAALAAAKNVPILFICTHLDDADAIADDVEVLTGMAAELFPAWELGPDVPGVGGLADHVSDEVTGERLRICTLLATDPQQRDESVDVLVAPVVALMQPVPTPEALAAARLSLQEGDEIAPKGLVGWLVDAGFEPVDAVDQQGEFARRGGIVDIFPPGVAQPVRVEFFGDVIESVRRFDLDTQRSVGQIGGYSLVGLAAGKDTDPARTTTLLDYLPDEGIVCVIEPAEVASLAETFFRRLEAPEGTHSGEEVFAVARRMAWVEMHTFGPSVQGEDPDAFAMGIESLQRLEVNTAAALEELERLSLDNEVWVYCENAAERNRFMELIAAAHGGLAERVKTGIGHVSHGFRWPAERLVVVGHHEVFHRYARPRRLRRVRAGRPIDSFVDLQQGDYVVHVAHGIAKFEGLRMLDKQGRKEEYLTLRFANGAMLHVPVTEIHLVQKYIGARRGHPTLSRLGGSAWESRKQRVTEAVEDLAAELLRVQALRASSPGVSYRADSEWQKQFEEEFIYTETEDQIASSRQIFSDMADARPMDRLLCGDVGFGKTELAMRAAFAVVEAGKQAAVLVPTTVLAAQHYRTFTERFADYPIVVDMISRFRTKAEQEQIVERVAAGKIDVLIGTHRLLSPDVRFSELGLAIIDEEQRFGVEHKEHLKRMRATVDVLTMTATPIPRTLHLALLGLRDISNLTTPPLDRRAIYTEVCRRDDRRIRSAILHELDRDGQVFFVHNRVQGIESVADHIRTIAPEARVEVGHGQMPERRLEKTMLRFVRGEIDVLVCTTIIESGLDIPTANTMFIDEADRFGLSQLHQLRGRIGRYKHRAYCYLLLPERRSVNRVAAKRLKAVEEFSDLGAGFQIAMRDLEIRGAGNILGPEQSGHIAAVGYELYCQLLEQSVHKLRGEAPPPQIDVHVELGLDAYIPRSYITSSRQRMEVYRRLATSRTMEELAQLPRDLADAFGPVPDEVDALLTVAEIRVLAGMLGIEMIVLVPPDVVFSIRTPGLADVALAGLAGSVRLADQQTAHWRPPPAYLEYPTVLVVLRKQLKQAAARL